jgi:hypothetical protein
VKHNLFTKAGMIILGVLLLLNLAVTTRTRAQANPGTGGPLRYKVHRVDISTNQDLVFQQAAQEGWNLVGTIEIAGSTGYLIFKK